MRNMEEFIGGFGANDVREQSVLLQEITLSQTELRMIIEVRKDDEGVFGILTIGDGGIILVVLSHANFRALVNELSKLNDRYYHELRESRAVENSGEIIGKKSFFASIARFAKRIIKTLFNGSVCLGSISLRQNKRFLTFEARKGEAGVFGIVRYSAEDVSSYVLNTSNFQILVEGLSKLRDDF